MSNTSSDNISEIKKNISRLDDLLKYADLLITSGKIKEGNQELLEAEKLSEKIVNATRLLPNAYGLDTPDLQEELKNNIICENDIVLTYLEEDVFYAKLPFLLPKKNGGNPIYVRSSLQVALEDFFSEDRPVKIDEPATIIFRHNYSFDTPEKEYRDHDNIEINVVVDLLALYILIDDAPLRLRHYYLSVPSDENVTEIYVLPNRKFLQYAEQLG